MKRILFILLFAVTIFLMYENYYQDRVISYYREYKDSLINHYENEIDSLRNEINILNTDTLFVIDDVLDYRYFRIIGTTVNTNL